MKLDRSDDWISMILTYKIRVIVTYLIFSMGLFHWLAVYILLQSNNVSSWFFLKTNGFVSASMQLKNFI
jgi:hypothetical protein